MVPAGRQQFKERRFAILLGILLVLLAGSPILIGFGLSAVWFDGLTSVLMLASIVSLCFEPQQRWFALVVGVPSIALSLGGHVSSVATVLFLGHLCEVLFLLGASFLIVKSLFIASELSADSIFGAICGYLFLGLAWAVIYSMIEGVRPGSFELKASLADLKDPSRPISDVLTYYSFVTLTTVGYGDVVPATPTTRTCAWIEAICGQFYVAVVVAGLVSMLASRPRETRTTAGRRH